MSISIAKDGRFYPLAGQKVRSGGQWQTLKADDLFFFAGSWHLAGAHGALYGMGKNASGELGLGHKNEVTELTEIPLPGRCQKVSSHDGVTYFICGGRLYRCGANFGATPVLFDDRDDWTDVLAGLYADVAYGIRNRRLYRWGAGIPEIDEPTACYDGWNDWKGFFHDYIGIRTAGVYRCLDGPALETINMGDAGSAGWEYVYGISPHFAIRSGVLYVKGNNASSVGPLPVGHGNAVSTWTAIASSNWQRAVPHWGIRNGALMHWSENTGYLPVVLDNSRIYTTLTSDGRYALDADGNILSLSFSTSVPASFSPSAQPLATGDLKWADIIGYANQSTLFAIRSH